MGYRKFLTRFAAAKGRRGHCVHFEGLKSCCTVWCLRGRLHRYSGTFSVLETNAPTLVPQSTFDAAVRHGVGRMRDLCGVMQDCRGATARKSGVARIWAESTAMHGAGRRPAAQG